MTKAHRPASRGLMLLSIRPRYVSAILSGAKTIELRRTCPKVSAGQPVAIYATSPLSAVVATCTVTKIEMKDPGTLKSTAVCAAAVSEAEYDTYFDGASRAVAIHLENVVALHDPVTLRDMRGNHGTFQPPQSWHFLDEAQLSRLVRGHVAHRALAHMLGTHPTSTSRAIGSCDS